MAIHVSPQGDDDASGTAARPLLTLEAAQRRARAARAEAGPGRVVVHEGTYHLTRTLTFGPEDSGTPQAPVSYEAASGARVVLSGGWVLAAEWRSYERGVLVAGIGKGLDFDELFVNGRRQSNSIQGQHTTRMYRDCPEAASP
ncbi:hypothetical protein ABZ611_09005 [Streptomyces sp. NPDC007861]|uniref:hypothetical protein n=1 Tax=Streptomyces sp. NPDC007861 TaxID=3154893 RepID=UPI0033E0AB4B